jgi:hypothetical protein
MCNTTCYEWDAIPSEVRHLCFITEVTYGFTNKHVETMTSTSYPRREGSGAWKKYTRHVQNLICILRPPVCIVHLNTTQQQFLFGVIYFPYHTNRNFVPDGLFICSSFSDAVSNADYADAAPSCGLRAASGSFQPLLRLAGKKCTVNPFLANESVNTNPSI